MIHRIRWNYLHGTALKEKEPPFFQALNVTSAIFFAMPERVTASPVYPRLAGDTETEEEILSELQSEEECHSMATHFDRDELGLILGRVLAAIRKAVMTHSFQPVLDEVASLLATSEILLSSELSKEIAESAKEFESGTDLVPGERFMKMLSDE